MKRKRIGNDINIAWAIMTEDGKPFDLSIGKVSLYLKNYVRKEEVKGFSIEGNVILWTFLGKNQKNLGNHSLELVINEDAEGMITTDACDFVCLVPCSCKEGGEDDAGVKTETVNLTSVITLCGGGGSYDDTGIKEAIAELDKTKQDTIEDLEAIREGAAKGATALQSVPAEYVTETELNNKGFATISEVEKKQDIIIDLDTIRAGALKGASSLQSVPSEYVTDSELSSKGYATTSQVAAKQDKLVSGSNIKTINGQSIVGSGNIEIEGGSDIDPSIFATKDELNDKQDKISDLDSIRSGAALGATALQSVPADYVTSAILAQEIANMENQITGVASAIPTKTSQLNNDSGLATEDYVNQQVRNSIISALNTEV